MKTCFNRVVGYCVVLSWLLCAAAIAEPLAKSAVPDPLKSWIPWVLHGH